MRRRDLLAGLAGLSVLGGGAFFATRSQTEETIEPVSVERIDRSGESAGELRVPERGQPTVLTVFATWCSICRRTMPEVAEAHDEVEDIQFVSVSNEAIGQTTTRKDVAEWWQAHGGDWPVAVDTDLELTSTFDIRTVPHTVVLDSSNQIVYDETGEKTAEDITSAVASI